MSDGICNDQEAIADIMNSGFGEILGIMKQSIELKGLKEHEWVFQWNDIKFTIKVEKK